MQIQKVENLILFKNTNTDGHYWVSTPKYTPLYRPHLSKLPSNHPLTILKEYHNVCYRELVRECKWFTGYAQYCSRRDFVMRLPIQIQRWSPKEYCLFMQGAILHERNNWKKNTMYILYHSQYLCTRTKQMINYFIFATVQQFKKNTFNYHTKSSDLDVVAVVNR